MTEVALRKFPYPYSAALAIASDVDETKDLAHFLEIQNFLCSDNKTYFGKGLGLEIGNSFFMYGLENELAYFSISDKEKEIVRTLIKSGFIDCFHSYGSGAKSREQVKKALKELEKHNCKITVWIDHAKASTNMGKDVTFGQGDMAGSPVYHADLTLKHGVEFAWLGRVSSIVGQSAKQGFVPRSSFINKGKEAVKHFMGLIGNKKYSLHYGNKLIKVVSLADKQPVFEFMRCDYHSKGVGRVATFKGLAAVLSENNLAKLIKSKGYCVIYTHLGKQSDKACADTVQALSLVKEANINGKLFVATTSRLLKYFTNFSYLDWSFSQKGAETEIKIKAIINPVKGLVEPVAKNLEGLTFFVPNKDKARIYLGERLLEDISKNKPDLSGRESVTIPFRPLRWPL